MKKLILLLILVLLLAAGGGGAYWWFFLGGLDIPVAEQVEEPEQENKPIFIDLESLTIPVIRGGAVAKYILLRVTLEVEDAAAEEQVKDRMPLLMDAYIRDLHHYFASIPINDKLNVRTVKRRMQRVSDRIVGPGVVSGILIQGAFEKKS